MRMGPAETAYILSRRDWYPAKHLRLISDKIVETVIQARRTRTRGQIIITAPPRHGKSKLTSHWTPCWFLSKFPKANVILASYGAELAGDWGRLCRNTIAENSYELGIQLSRDSKAGNRWHLRSGGGMITSGVGGAITGRGGDLLLIDDPVKNDQDALSSTYRKRAWNWWQATASTRVEPGGSVILLMTRWHEDDLAGRLIKQGGWTVINLPAICEADGDPLGRARGEALWPGRFSVDDLDRIKADIGTYWWNALYQQRPSPPEGMIIKRGWWKHWKVLPERFDEVLLSCDFSFSEGQSNSFVCIQAWGRAKANKFLLGQLRAQQDFVGSLAMLETMSRRFPEARLKLVENKANGPAIISTLRGKIPGIVPVEPDGSKQARAFAVSPQVEAGQVYLPDPEVEPWVVDFLDEWGLFPNGTYDDQVDACTQALKRWASGFEREVLRP